MSTLRTCSVNGRRCSTPVLVCSAGMNHSRSARLMCDQRACRVSPIRVPWQSISNANRPSPGLFAIAPSKRAIRSCSWVPRNRDGLMPTLALEKSLNLMPVIGFDEIRPSLNACRKDRASNWNTERT
ncbi:hypothetical protein D3C75_914170 [compost metagenome]